MSHHGAVDALGDNRRLVIGLSVAAGVAGQIPIPVVGELAHASVRALLARSLARRRGIIVGARESLLLSGGEHGLRPGAVVASFGVRLVWRRLTRALFVLYRFDDMAKTFVFGTQFDYYCVALHRGNVLDRARSEAVRAALVRAGESARGRVAAELFGKAVSDLLAAGLALPRALRDLAARVLGSADEAEVERVVEEDAGGVVARLVRLVERELGAAGRVSLEALCDAFEEAWSLKGADGLVVDGRSG